MSTRSNVAVKDGDKWIQSYVHYDGYPEHMMSALSNINSKDAAINLVKGGDIRYIGPDGEVEYFPPSKNTFEVVSAPELQQDYLYWFEEGMWKYTT